MRLNMPYIPVSSGYGPLDTDPKMTKVTDWLKNTLSKYLKVCLYSINHQYNHNLICCTNPLTKVSIWIQNTAGYKMECETRSLPSNNAQPGSIHNVNHPNLQSESWLGCTMFAKVYIMGNWTVTRFSSTSFITHQHCNSWPKSAICTSRFTLQITLGCRVPYKRGYWG